MHALYKSTDMTADTTYPTFKSLGLSAEVLRVLEELGYEEPTPIQTHAIPPLLGGRDVLGSAATGTGKTAAFALPLIERLDAKAHAVQGLIMTPTRELAMQVAEAVHRYGVITASPCFRSTAASRSSGSSPRSSAACRSSSARPGGCSITSGAAASS